MGGQAESAAQFTSAVLVVEDNLKKALGPFLLVSICEGANHGTLEGQKIELILRRLSCRVDRRGLIDTVVER